MGVMKGHSIRELSPNFFWSITAGSQLTLQIVLSYFFECLFIFEKERDRAKMGEEQRERGRHRIRSRLQALSYQRRARCGARTRELWDHDQSQSWTLNWLSHAGAPFLIFMRNFLTLFHSWLHQFTFPPTANKGFPFLYIFANTCSFLFFWK